ncbi:SE1561 family protein [Bacillus sp. FJAT-27445]|uniref:SE1561 family protein n=1 Tax=Bacillus sp. FJAT-27445 TaxID=1679166 RepID=UPI000743729A|nr:SE1561 family protein [Bacillus sp. FJAT-27445]
MGKDITDKDTQVTFLKQRLNMFMELLEAIEPEEADVDDIDRLLEIIDDIESKVREFNNRDL